MALSLNLGANMVQSGAAAVLQPTVSIIESHGGNFSDRVIFFITPTSHLLVI